MFFFLILSLPLKGTWQWLLCRGAFPYIHKSYAGGSAIRNYHQQWVRFLLLRSANSKIF